MILNLFLKNTCTQCDLIDCNGFTLNINANTQLPVYPQFSGLVSVYHSVSEMSPLKMSLTNAELGCKYHLFQLACTYRDKELKRSSP